MEGTRGEKSHLVASQSFDVRPNSLEVFQQWISNLLDTFHWKFLFSLSYAQWGIKGFIHGGGEGGLMLAMQSYYYLSQNLPSSTKAHYAAITWSALGLKPLWALVMDLLPVSGRKCTPYMIATTGGAIVVVLLLLTTSPSPQVACAYFFCLVIQMAWSDIATESMYTARMKFASPGCSSDLLTYVWSGISLFTIFGVMIAGPSIDRFGYSACAAIALPVLLGFLLPLLRGWFLEEPQNPADKPENLLTSPHLGYYIMCFVNVLAIFLLDIYAAFGTVKECTTVGLVVLIGLCVSCRLLLPVAIWKPMIYIMLNAAFHVNINAAAEYFFIDPKDVYPEGPNFTATFYVAWMGIVPSVVTLVSAVVLNRYLIQWTYVQ
ncbi:hypothetical protein CYMTET_56166, partial [Cymbomonas tetramitiformis]